MALQLGTCRIYLKVIEPTVVLLKYHASHDIVAFQGRLRGLDTAADEIIPTNDKMMVGYNPKIRNLVIYSFLNEFVPAGNHVLATINLLEEIKWHQEGIGMNDMHVGGYLKGEGSFHMRTATSGEADVTWLADKFKT